MKNDITLWDFVVIAQRHWRLIALGLLGTLGLAIVATAMIKPKYRSEALLLVRLGRENLGVDPIAGMGDKAGVNMVDTRENEINSMTNVIKSRQMAEQVVDRLTPAVILDEPDSLKERVLSLVGGRLFPYYAISDRDKAVLTLQNKLRIKALEKSSVIRVSYDSPDPLQARTIVANMVELYLTFHSQIHRTTGSLSFLESELKTTRQQLLAKEEDLRTLKSQSGLIAPTDQRSSRVARISKLKTDLMDAQANRDAIKVELESLGKTLETMPETEVASQVTGAGNSAVDSMRSKVFDLQTQLNELLAKYNENHVKVIQLRHSIANAESILQQEENNRQQTTNGRSKSFDETSQLVVRKKSELAGLSAKLTSLATLVAGEEKELDELNTVELRIDQLAREIGILNSNFQKYSGDVERTRIDSDLETKSMTNVSVAQPASLNYMPVFPIVPLNIAIGGVLGVFVGGLLALLAEMRRQRLLNTSSGSATANRTVHSRLDFLSEPQELELEASIRNPR